MTARKTVVVLGADGYLGWPTSVHLSAQGHDVVAVDSLVRRRWDRQGGTASLVPIKSMPERVRRWKAVSGREIEWRRLDLLDADGLARLLAETRPDAIVHFAEQRSAPFSMVDRYHAVMTQHNNVVGTLNLLFAMRDHAPNCHLIKLGTMGEYGTPNLDIAEGFFEVDYRGRHDRVPFPRQAGSWYHWSKVHDSGNVMFATRIWGLRATDVMQGVLYGTRTPELSDDRLLTRFDFDEVWGTALNRFVVEAILKLPITPYGKGEQRRGFIALEDSMQSLRLALENPPDPGEYRVFNQFDAAYSVNELAEKVRAVAERRGRAPVIEHPPDPRVEAEQHYYNPLHDHLPRLGYVRQRTLDTVIEEIFDDLLRFRRRLVAKQAVVAPGHVNWRVADNRPSPPPAGPASPPGPPADPGSPGP